MLGMPDLSSTAMLGMPDLSSTAMLGMPDLKKTCSGQSDTRDKAITKRFSRMRLQKLSFSLLERTSRWKYLKKKMSLFFAKRVRGEREGGELIAIIVVLNSSFGYLPLWLSLKSAHFWHRQIEITREVEKKLFS